MKLKYALSMVLLAIGSVFRFGAREECHNAVSSTVSTHENGNVPLAAEEAISTRYLLVKKGTAANGILINGATDRPWGVCLDEPASGDKATVGILGATVGTLKVIAGAAVTAGSKVYTAASGKVTGTHATGVYCLGIAVTSASSDGDLVEISPRIPTLDASGTTL